MKNGKLFSTLTALTVSTFAAAGFVVAPSIAMADHHEGHHEGAGEKSCSGQNKGEKHCSGETNGEKHCAGEHAAAGHHDAHHDAHHDGHQAQGEKSCSGEKGCSGKK